MGEARFARPWAGPPPTIAAVDAVWWGARNGGWSSSGLPGREQPGYGVDPGHF